MDKLLICEALKIGFVAALAIELTDIGSYIIDCILNVDIYYII